MTITLTKEEALNILDDGACVIETEPWRWGTSKRFVFGRGDKHYAFWVRYQVEEGMVDDVEYDAVEVLPVEKTVVTWEDVREAPRAQIVDLMESLKASLAKR